MLHTKFRKIIDNLKEKFNSIPETRIKIVSDENGVKYYPQKKSLLFFHDLEEVQKSAELRYNKIVTNSMEEAQEHIDKLLNGYRNNNKKTEYVKYPKK